MTSFCSSSLSGTKKFGRRLKTPPLRPPLSPPSEAPLLPSSSSSPPPRDVPCGPCAASGRTVRAVRSCLHCEESYCAEHVRGHQREPNLSVHELVGPVHRLQARVCKQHSSPLDLVCHDDLTAVCVTCMNSEHKDHRCVPLKNRLRSKKTQVEQELEDVQQKIQERRVLMESFSESGRIIERNSASDVEALVKLLKLIQMLLQLNQGAVVAALLVLKRQAQGRSETMKKKLQTEVQKLERRQGALKRLSQAEDGLHLLQNWSSLGAAPHLDDWSNISPFSDPAVGTSRSALAKMLVEMMAVITEGTKALEAKEVERVQQYAVNLTLDSNTAHPLLKLSPDGTEVSHAGSPQPVPDQPQRFDTLTGVLSKQCFSSGAFYFEVQVEDVTSWEIGVALETADRKGPVKPHLSTGFAVLTLLDDTLTAMNRPPKELPLPPGPLKKVGVFVYIEGGEVGFYDVTRRAHIYTFTGCSFPKVRLHPYVNPAPQQRVSAGRMVFSPVIQGADDSQSEEAEEGAESEAGAESEGGAAASSDSDEDMDLDELLSQLMP
ncbi:hypothetical protein WMY93_002461 [Mugilogobius chulae]|uniref:B box-type domain-containing protein n=1 Tax=Mugilogobius chulae TaxID=88201 RepID=A0AAW0PVN4_9GOBI